MVSAIDFAVRDGAGGKQYGNVAGDGQSNLIQVGSGDSISLNLSQASVTAYEQRGGDLIVSLSDGRTIVLSNYFNEAAGQVNHLYLSSEGEMIEVMITEGTDGVLFADYGPVSGWDKWSPLDDLRFTTADNVADAVYVSNEPAGMAPFVPGLLGGLGGLGPIAALAGGAAIIGATGGGGKGDTGGGTGGGGTGGGGVTPDTTAPAVSINQGTETANHVENLVDYGNGVTIGGTSEPGAAISVVVNNHTQTTTTDVNGNWTVTFPTTEVDPGDYTIPVTVTATDAAGNSSTATDQLVVDTIPIPITFNAVGGDDKVNMVDNQGDLIVTGHTDPGAVLAVTLRGVTLPATADGNGNWTVTYGQGLLPAGNGRSETITATTTDNHGNATSSTHSFVVDTQVSVAFSGQATGDGIVDRGEAGTMIALSGTAEAGAAISVSWYGQTIPTTASADGTWTVSFPTNMIPSTITTMTNSTATVTATDSFGNTASATQTIRLDTQTFVGIDSQQVIDNAISGPEVTAATNSANGITFTGTAEPGARVEVSFENGSHTVYASAEGTWSANFATSEFRAGTYDSTISVRSTDGANNVATASHAIHVDTEVTPFATTSFSTGVDNVLNGTEALNGLTVTGTVEANSTVMVKLGNGSYHAAKVVGTTWSYAFAAGEVTAGDLHNMNVTAIATDRYSNTSTLTSTVAVDTEVVNLHATNAVGGDSVLNAAEAAAGVTLTGTSEAHSTVVVRLATGAQVTTQAGADGNWSAHFDQNQLPSGTGGTSSVTVTATDLAQNVDNYTQTFTYDTVAPADPWITNDAGTGNTISGIATATSPDHLTYHAVSGSGGATELHPQAEFNGNVDVNGQTVASEWAFFSNPVPDGSYLVINDTDVAGNESSTLYLRSTGPVTVDLSRAGLSEFDFGTIDLTSSTASLTLSEAQINNLTGVDKQMAIAGGSDDHVNLIGASDAVTHHVVNGESYSLYTLGTGGASVLIDDDILVSHTGV